MQIPSPASALPGANGLPCPDSEPPTRGRRIPAMKAAIRQSDKATATGLSIFSRLGRAAALGGGVVGGTGRAFVGAGRVGRIVRDLIQLLGRTGVGVLDRCVAAAATQSPEQDQRGCAWDRSSSSGHDRSPSAWPFDPNAREGADRAKLFPAFAATWHEDAI